jgi:hypothetical protein
MVMTVSNPLSLIGRKVLVRIPQWSTFGGLGAKFGGSWECNIAKLATSLNRKPFKK